MINTSGDYLFVDRHTGRTVWLSRVEEVFSLVSRRYLLGEYEDRDPSQILELWLDGDRIYRPGRFVVYDVYGRRVPRAVLEELGTPSRAEILRRWNVRRYGTFVFRDGPVKSTGKRTWRSVLRHPRTAAERRAAIEARADAREHSETIGARLAHNLRHRRAVTEIVSAWDDIPRSDREDRSWKRHRRTRWRCREART